MFVDMLAEYASVVPAGAHGMEVPGREIILIDFARSVNFFRAEGIQSPADLRRALMSSRAEMEAWMTILGMSGFGCCRSTLTFRQERTCKIMSTSSCCIGSVRSVSSWCAWGMCSSVRRLSVAEPERVS